MTTEAKTCLVHIKGGKPARVKQFARFKRTIQGDEHLFAVTEQPDGIGQCLTHVKSGRRVCALGVGASYLPAYAGLKSASYRARGEMSLDALIAEKGEAVVRSVLASAPDLA
jgi:hypothetical protein